MVETAIIVILWVCCLCWNLSLFIEWLAKKGIRKNNEWYINRIREIRNETPLDMTGWSDYELESKAEEIHRSTKNAKVKTCEQ